ncbi:MAG: hypothetical protein ABH831_02790 [Candidatus Nealsonbacteria bacterium]
MFFYGQWFYVLDHKRRVPIPPVFRKASQDGVVITRTRNGNIRLYLRRGKLPFSEVYLIVVDSWGRVRIPTQILFPLDPENNEVMWTGKGNYLELTERKGVGVTVASK